MPMFATTDGTKLYYEDTGKGPALVFCHGLNSSHLANKRFIDEFRGEYRCICYDQRGHAASERPSRHLNVATLGRDLRDLLEYLGVERASVVGHSMGAATVFSYVGQFGCAPFETGFPGTTHAILEESPREVAARVKPFLRGEV